MLRGCGTRRLAAVAAAGLVGTMVLAGAADAQEAANDAAALNAEVVRLYRAGKYAEAMEIAERLLAIREKALGPDHPLLNGALKDLAELYRVQGRLAEAESLFKRGIAIAEKALGSGHSVTALLLNNLAALYQDQGRYADAEPLFKRSLAIREKALGRCGRSVQQPSRPLPGTAPLHRGRAAL